MVFGARKTKYTDLAFFITLVFFVSLMIFKVFHSVCDNDESTVLFDAYRYFRGSRLSTEEKLAGMFVLPVVGLWCSVAGTTEGIVIFSRLSFVAAQTACAIFLYARLKRYGVAAVPAVLIFFFNVPLWSMTLIYYNTVLVM
ncbi:MAG: hypothetical protein K6G90_07125, partial [Clostridia bacterium]|nr:hypothetical protein [Clostridia bacterium]